MADLDCRILAMMALALSLLSLSCVIFFRHHHHHHSNEYRIPEALVRTANCPPCLSNETQFDEDYYLHENQTLCELNSASTLQEDSEFDISEVCLQCICEASTECKPSKCSGEEMCGIFRISKPYWIDAGKPILNGGTHDDVDDFTKAYLLCVNNPFCAARTVKAYINKNKRDCDGDGVIDCYDYAASHIQGPRGCRLEKLSSQHFGRLYRCLSKLTLNT